MPYNTTAIPPRKEVTGQTQLPLSRVKKIIAQDQDINVCSNNAAFVITLATEMFVQYLAGEGLNMAKLERKPRRNIQYKDIANAVSHQDNLQFLEDMVPKTVPYKQIKAHAAATRANLTGGAKTTDGVAIASLEDPQPTKQSGKKQKSNGRASGGSAGLTSFVGRVVSEDEDPNDQLRSEMQQASGDVHMSG
ncbi:histone-fold-containing protein [Xylariaceae sp. FL1272]|nr:histone-fold-containing protein [Xylariaceae sp. FL1272]